MDLWQNRESNVPFAQQVGSFSCHVGRVVLRRDFAGDVLEAQGFVFTTVTDKREHVRECDQSTTQMHVLCRDIFWTLLEISRIFGSNFVCVFWRSNSESHVLIIVCQDVSQIMFTQFETVVCRGTLFVRRDFPHFAHSEGAQLRWNAATSSVKWGIVRFIMWCLHAHCSVIGRILEFTSFSGYEPRAHVHTNNCRFCYRLVFNVRHFLCILLLR